VRLLPRISQLQGFFSQEEATIEWLRSRITFGGFPTSRPSGR
jgi:hypothetical protein